MFVNEQFVLNVIENLVAQFPQLIIVVTTVYYGIKSVKRVSFSMPDLLQNTKKELSSSYDSSKELIVKMLKDTTKQLKEEVTQSLVEMASELKDYKKRIKENAEQTNLIVRQNQLFMDVISDLLKQDPELVRAGIRKAVSTKISLTKEQLEKYPNTLINDLDILFSSLKEAMLVVGKENFDELLGELGYERKEV